MQSLSVVFDRGLEKSISDLFSSKNDECFGILIGQKTSSAIFVVHFAKTGRNFETLDEKTSDDGQPDDLSQPKRGAKKPTPQQQQQRSSFDDRAILRHVRQAIRMLPGGVEIVGFFVALSSADKKKNENLASISKALRSAYKICSKLNGTSLVRDDSAPSDGRMVLLTAESAGNNKKPFSTLIIDCGPDAQLSSPSSTVPFSYQSLRWRGLSTRLVFDIPLFVPTTQSAESFLKQFSDAVRPWYCQFWNSTATINGSLRDVDEPLSTTVASTKSGKGKQTAEEVSMDFVDFYLNDDQNFSSKDQADAKSENGAVSMHIRGTMYCVAFVHQKATVAEGLRALKADVLRSLYGRCELHYDGMAVLEGEELDPVAVHQFPRRVCARLASSPILFSDYLFESDVSTDAVASFQCILGVDVDPDTIEDKVEKVPCEKSLEKLLKSASSSSTPEGSVGDGDRMNLEELERLDRGHRRRGPVVYFLLSIVIAMLAYLFYFLFRK